MGPAGHRSSATSPMAAKQAEPVRAELPGTRREVAKEGKVDKSPGVIEGRVPPASPSGPRPSKRPRTEPPETLPTAAGSPGSARSEGTASERHAAPADDGSATGGESTQEPAVEGRGDDAAAIEEEPKNADQDDVANLGEELCRERKLRKIDLTEIANATKVNLRFLEALESNNFASLPGGLFNRGMIRAYATHIGADPKRLVEVYRRQTGEEDERAKHLAAGLLLEPPETPDDVQEPSWLSSPRFHAFVVLLALLAALALSLLFFPR